MANKKPDYVAERDGYKVEFRRRRDGLDADVIDGDGNTVAELEYPKLPRTLGAEKVMDEFAGEAVMIAKRNAEKKAEKHG